MSKLSVGFHCRFYTTTHRVVCVSCRCILRRCILCLCLPSGHANRVTHTGTQMGAFRARNMLFSPPICAVLWHATGTEHLAACRNQCHVCRMPVGMSMGAYDMAARWVALPLERLDVTVGLCTVAGPQPQVLKYLRLWNSGCQQHDTTQPVYTAMQPPPQAPPQLPPTHHPNRQFDCHPTAAQPPGMSASASSLALPWPPSSWSRKGWHACWGTSR